MLITIYRVLENERLILVLDLTTVVEIVKYVMTVYLIILNSKFRINILAIREIFSVNSVSRPSKTKSQ